MRKLRFVLVALVVLLATAAQGYCQTRVPRGFNIDPEHSSITFSVPFMGMSVVKGEFGEFSGALLLGDDPATSSVTALIRTRSIGTHSAARDRHLRSPDFLAADSFPTIWFQSQRIEKTPAGFVAHGDFTMRGVTRAIVLPFQEVSPPVLDAWKNTRATYRATTRLSRRDYGVRGTAFWNSEFDPGRFAVGDTVTVDLEITASIPNTASWTVPGTDSLARAVEEAGAERVIAQWLAADSAKRLSPSAVMIAGYKLSQRGRTADAVRLLSWAGAYFTALEMRSMGLAVAGELQLANGDRAAATKSFEAAAKANPEDPKAIAWLRWLGASSK